MFFEIGVPVFDVSIVALTVCAWPDAKAGEANRETVSRISAYAFNAANRLNEHIIGSSPFIAFMVSPPIRAAGSLYLRS